MLSCNKREGLLQLPMTVINQPPQTPVTRRSFLSLFQSSLQIIVDDDDSKIWSLYDAGPRSIRCPLIFLPPVSGTADVFFQQILALTGWGYRVIAVSMAASALNLTFLGFALLSLTSYNTGNSLFEVRLYFPILLLSHAAFNFLIFFFFFFFLDRVLPCNSDCPETFCVNQIDFGLTKIRLPLPHPHPQCWNKRRIPP